MTFDNGDGDLLAIFLMLLVAVVLIPLAWSMCRDRKKRKGTR